MTREEAIKIIRKMLACTDLTVRANLNADMVSACNFAIKALEQESKTGHWINKRCLFDSCSAECSSCHKRSNGYMHGFNLVPKYYDFCPKCGIKMESEGE